ncbi:hypothetical protein [Herminiimonas sp. CN]|uniref:hypothetical protein n=1 Tax=Herminiimonas sp. CN TaxID=1349818 RepID=UPI0004733119|nr:hypothetical protein [Herminiimonas sp. CN]
MNTPALLKAQSLVRAGDIVGAEHALVALAETEGDRALVVALDDLPPSDLLAIIREYDVSKESVVNLLVTPEQFARAVVLERRYNDLSHEHLRGMINSVIFREGCDAGEFLHAIGDTDGGCDALVDYLSDKADRVEHFFQYSTFDLFKYGDESKAKLVDYDLAADPDEHPRLSHEEVNDHDWMELTWTLRYVTPDLFSEVLTMLRTRWRDHQRMEALAEAALNASGADEEKAPAATLGEESAL